VEIALEAIGECNPAVARDIEIIKRELPVDLLEFFIPTPLPGSEDHKDLQGRGVAMDPDMNSYGTEARPGGSRGGGLSGRGAATAPAGRSRERWVRPGLRP
jgi:hypothetical protein